MFAYYKSCRERYGDVNFKRFLALKKIQPTNQTYLNFKKGFLKGKRI